MTYLQPLLLIGLIFVVQLCLARKYDGVQEADLSGRNLKASHTGQRRGKFDATRSGPGYSGSADGKNYNVDGTKSGPAHAQMNGRKNSALTAKRGEYEANSYKNEKAVVSGAVNGKADKITAGNKELSARTASSSRSGKKAEALNRKDRDQYRGSYNKNIANAGTKNARGKTASAKVGNRNDVQAKCKGGRGCGDDVKVQQRGDQATMQTKRGRKYQAMAQRSGFEQHTKYTQDGRVGYDSSVIKAQNQAKLYNPGGRNALADVKMTEEGERSCDNFDDPKNLWAGRSKSKYVKNRDIRVKMQGKNGEHYTWPSCFEIAVDVTIPAGVRIRDLVGMVNVAESNCGSIKCGNQEKCGDYQCVFKDLCGDKRDAERVDGVGSFLGKNSQISKADCDEVRSSEQKRTITMEYCPNLDDDWRGENGYCKRDLMSTMSTASLEVQAKILKADKPKAQLQCKPNEMTLVACRRAIVKYEVKWFGVGNPVFKFAETGAKALRGVKNLGGEGWGYGGEKPNLVNQLFGGGNNGRNNNRNGGVLGGLLGGNNRRQG